MSAPRRPSPSGQTPASDSSPAGAGTNIPSQPVRPPLPGAPRRRLDGGTGLALLAVVIAGVALAIGLVNALGRGQAGCDTAAWDAVPAASALPAGWTLGTTDFYVGSQTTTLVGPLTDDSAGGAAVYASVTCYGDSAGDALRRTRTSAESSGATVTDLDGIGDEGYSMADSSTVSSAYHFRRGGLVAYVAPSGSVTPAELDQLAIAVDAAMATSQGGPTPSVPARPSAAPTASETPEASAEESPGPNASTEPESSPVAPALEARLPSEVGGVTLTKDSATGDVVLQDDASSRALAAALRTLDKSPTDLLLAQAYDESGTLAGSIMGFELPGVEGAELRTIILDAWLLAGSPGVTTTEVTLAGKPFTKVSYGDGVASSYVYVADGAVLVIDAPDEDQAGQFAAGLP
jgi:hypothetical protein